MTAGTIIGAIGVAGVVALLLAMVVLRLDGARRRHAVRRRDLRRRRDLSSALTARIGDYTLRNELDDDGAFPRGCP